MDQFILDCLENFLEGKFYNMEYADAVEVTQDLMKKKPEQTEKCKHGFKKGSCHTCDIKTGTEIEVKPIPKSWSARTKK